MIARIEGKIIEKNPAYTIIDCNGVGYKVNVSLHTYSQLPDSGTCVLHTQQIIREDAHLLYGFFQKSEKEMFNLLISVSGVGASSANLILSAMDPGEIQEAIVNGDVGSLKGVKGIGNKTAERIIVDLRDKLSKEEITSISPGLGNSLKDEALSALLMLGYNKALAEKSLSKVMKDNNDQVSVELLVKAVLKGN
ncbi:MAG TPA: Holliday junction branch migration protein RuvA [Flavobacteriales bacterium]|nr:Holliday junction branch migration protein RuvA [Flavobacteriales bacterium]